MRLNRISQETDGIRMLADKIQQILLNSQHLSTTEIALLNQYRKAFTWIHSVLFSENFESLFLQKKEPTKPKLVIIK